MVKNEKLWIAGYADAPIYLNPKMANRHGMIAGATGTGKTVTLKVMAEAFSNIGVPVFMADIKGDLSGMCMPGEDSNNMRERIEKFGLDGFKYSSFPTAFWDIFGERGTPIRATVSQIGPVLLSRILELSDVQEGVLNIVFRVADDNGLLLLDLKDLRAMLAYVDEHKSEYTIKYGNVTTPSIGAIQRALLKLEDEGAELFLGEPSFDIFDFIREDRTGRGFINILNASKLIQSPTLYSMFLLYLLTELYENLPEVGDPEKPKFVFFFDEAHLLFNNAPKALLEKIVQIVKLIRSKGVGVYFISQSPSDVPDAVLAQLSNRVQHALRAYTPSEIKAVKVAADTFRENPSFKTADVIMELGVGEALVSFLDEKGVPTVVERTKILPPESYMGDAPIDVINDNIRSGYFEAKYRDMIDRESAFEVLTDLAEQQAQEEVVIKSSKATKTAKPKQSQTSKTLQRTTNSMMTSVSRSISSNVAKSITGSGKKKSTSKILEQALTTGLSTLVRESGKGITRGLFGNIIK